MADLQIYWILEGAVLAGFEVCWRLGGAIAALKVCWRLGGAIADLKVCWRPGGAEAVFRYVRD